MIFEWMDVHIFFFFQNFFNFLNSYSSIFIMEILKPVEKFKDRTKSLLPLRGYNNYYFAMSQIYIIFCTIWQKVAEWIFYFHVI